MDRDVPRTAAKLLKKVVGRWCHGGVTPGPELPHGGRKLHHQMPNWTLHQGDCLDVLKRAPAPMPEPVTTPTPETEAPLTLDDLFGF